MATPLAPTVEWSKLTAPELNALAAPGQPCSCRSPPPSSMARISARASIRPSAARCAASQPRRRWPQRPVVVAPTLWVGMAEHHMAHGGTFTLDIPTYRAVLICLVRSLARDGFKRVLIVNGHGGNMTALNAFLPDIERETGLVVAATTYFELAQPAFAPLLEDQTSVLHACEAETAMMMAVAPEAVREDKLAEAVGPHFGDPRAVLAPPAQRFRSFATLTSSGVLGDARKATRQKGERLLAAATDALADLIVRGEPWE